jgi:hypothetical protein
MLPKSTPVTNLLIKELIEIKTNHFSFLADTEVHARDILQDSKKYEGNDERVGRDSSNLSELFSHLNTVSIDTAWCLSNTIKGRDPGLGEDAGADGTDHTADTVELEDIHALIDTNPLIKIGAESTDDGGDEADGAGDPWRNVTSCWCNANETGNGTAASSDNGELALVSDVVDEDPAENTGRGGSVGVECSHHGPDCTVDRRSTLFRVRTCSSFLSCLPLEDLIGKKTYVKAEPSKPNENSAEEDQSGVVWLGVRLLTSVLSLAQDGSIGKGAPSGTDMDRSSTGEIQARKLKQPTVGVPCPAGNRAVYDCGPEEGEHKGWNDAATFE